MEFGYAQFMNDMNVFELLPYMSKKQFDAVFISACQYGWFNCASECMKKYTKDTLLEKYGTYVLELICINGHIDIMKEFIKTYNLKKEDFLKKNKKNKSLLHLASKNEHDNIVDELIRAGDIQKEDIQTRILIL